MPPRAEPTPRVREAYRGAGFPSSRATFRRHRHPDLMLLLAFRRAAGAGAAVVELFTSEGCSSCPPADALLSELATENTPGVILIELHVDYWDRLGWPDPWAEKRFSERQRRYGERFDQV